MIRNTFRTIPLIVLLNGCSATPGLDGSGQDIVYVTNELGGSLSVIDAAKARVGKRPRGIVASPDRQTLYIALSGSPAAGPGVEAESLPPADKSADGIAVFDVATQRVARILRGVSDPEQMALSPEGGLLYVASEDSGLLVAIDTRSGAIVRSLKVGSEPEGVAVAPTGKLVAVTSEGENRVSIVDAATMTLRASIAVDAVRDQRAKPQRRHHQCRERNGQPRGRDGRLSETDGGPCNGRWPRPLHIDRAWRQGRAARCSKAHAGCRCICRRAPLGHRYGR
jgi:YVTN family beta-propeller protein